HSYLLLSQPSSPPFPRLLHFCLLLFFFLLLRPPPRSPLFPYTTLFRSPFFDALPGPPFELSAAYQRAVDAGVDVQLIVIPGTREDRKSTRLNSSHVAISYAVFCLKKKKKKRKKKKKKKINKKEE